MTLASTSDKESFYRRPAAELMERLVGERVMTPADLLVISQTKGFNGLVRTNMKAAHSLFQGQWEPGDISVTNYRGFPQINVLGKNPNNDDPQYIWLKEMQRADDPLTMNGTEDVKNPSLVKRIAEELGDGKVKPYEYAMDKIHGCNVLDPESPIRILPNIQHPFDKKRAQVDLLSGSVDNSVGTATLAIDAVRFDVDEQIRAIVQKEAERLKQDAETVESAMARILHPKNLGKTLQKSPILKKLFRRLDDLGLA
jgi:hypothetical protein